MDPMKPHDKKLQAWGCTGILDVRGVVKIDIKNSKEAQINRIIYVVERHYPESQLGDHDTENLGFITFDRKVRTPTKEATI